MKENFIRIAMARLRKTYPFKPQRRAVAAKMWSKYLERKAMTNWFNDQQCQAHARWQEEEEQLNARMDIIGQNGNTGEHYDQTS